MTTQILCRVDGGDNGSLGPVKAAGLARLTGAHLVLCTVNPALGGTRGSMINPWTE
jgi:hypothetical protein